MTTTILFSAVSQDTAFVQPDYPYSFHLRCERRCWIETTKHGQRFVTQTSNPKRPGTWNKPKAGTYSPVLVLVLDEEGRVEVHGLSFYDGEAKVDAFVELYGSSLTEAQQQTIRVMRAASRASKKVTWTVTSGPSSETREEERQTVKEQQELMGKLIGRELVEMKREEGK